MKKYADRNRKETVQYKELINTKDFIWQMKNIETKKLAEKFAGPYKIMKIISENVVKLELLVSMKIHLVVNVSRIAMYQKQVKRWKISPPLIEIDRKKNMKLRKY